MTMAEILQIALQSGSCAIRVALPGRVVKVKSSGRVDVQVELRTARPVVDGQYEYDKLPPLLDVPVLWQSTQAAAIVMKLAPGDPGLVVFADHALGAWLTAGALVSPALPDPHGASGAVFSPGLWPGDEGPDPVTSADVVVTGGDIRLGSVDADDPVALKSDLQTLYTAITTAAFGSSDGGAVLQENIKLALDAEGFPVSSQKVKAE